MIGIFFCRALAFFFAFMALVASMISGFSFYFHGRKSLPGWYCLAGAVIFLVLYLVFRPSGDDEEEDDDAVEESEAEPLGNCNEPGDGDRWDLLEEREHRKQVQAPKTVSDDYYGCGNAFGEGKPPRAA